jgi:hypothetical protein
MYMQWNRNNVNNNDLLWTSLAEVLFYSKDKKIL